MLLCNYRVFKFSSARKQIACANCCDLLIGYVSSFLVSLEKL